MKDRSTPARNGAEPAPNPSEYSHARHTYLELRPNGPRALLLMAAAIPAGAQAWLPAKGEGTVSVLVSNTLSKDHFLPDQRYDFGHIDANTVLFDVTYGLTDRMAVTVGLPIVDVEIPRRVSASADHAGRRQLAHARRRTSASTSATTSSAVRWS